MQTPEAIRDHLQEMLVQSIEVQAEKSRDEEWRTGVKGATLQGRINVLQEILDWMATDS